MTEPIVLLHGLAMSGRAWRPVLGALQDRFEVHTPTLPGHRGGAPVTGPVTIAGLTDAMEAYLDDHGLDRPHLVGNSLGGWIALELARRGRARSVTGLAPAGAWHRPSDYHLVTLKIGIGRWLVRVPGMGLHLLNPAGRRIMMRPLMEHGERLSRSEAATIMRDLRACTVIEQVLRIGYRDGGIEPLAVPGCPIRIVWGGRDRTISWNGYGRALTALVADADVHLLPDAGHVPMYGHPAEIAQLIIEHAGLCEVRQ